MTDTADTASSITCAGCRREPVDIRDRLAWLKVAVVVVSETERTFITRGDLCSEGCIALALRNAAETQERALAVLAAEPGRSS